MRAAIAAACAFALGTWAAFGAVALVGPETSPRLILPASPWILVVAALVAFAFILVRRPTAREAAPLWLPAIALVPWLPLPLPAAALTWTGPLARALVVVAIAGASAPLARTNRLRQGYGGREVRVARTKVRAYVRPSALAFAIAAVLYVGAAWTLSPVLPSGDEPHYLVIADSLLHDGDLKIENNHAARRYLAYVDGELKPDYLRRGRDGQIYSVHAPGLPALVLPAFAVAGYPGVVVFLALLSAVGAALAWRASFALTNDSDAAWIGWASVTLPAPFFFQAFTIFPDAPAAVIVMLVVYALVREEWLTSTARLAALGAALAFLPWLHTRYALIAVSAAIVIALRLRSYGRPRLLVSFIAIPLVSAALWLSMFQQIYGTFDPRAPYGGVPEMRIARIPVGLTGLLIDQQFGLLPNAPIYLIALGSLVPFAQRHRRLCIELIALAAPYVVAVAAFHMWWAGLSSPARFLVPVLLPVALPVAVLWTRHTTATRGVTLALLCGSVGITVAMTCAGGGTLLYNTRDGFARWLDWVAPAVNLAYALPSLFQGSVVAAWCRAAVWLAAVAAGWFALRTAERRRMEAPVLVVGLIAVATISLAATSGWLLSGRNGWEPGSSAIAMLRVCCGRDRMLPRVAPFLLSSSRVLDAGFAIRDAGRRPFAADGPIWTGRDIPPGRYRVWLDSGLNVSGTLTIALGKLDSTFEHCTFRENPPGASSCFVDLPAGATWLWMTPDQSMRSLIEGLRLQPIAVGAPDQCALRADRAVVTPAGIVFAEKGSVYAESSGLWVIGGKTARLSVQPHGQRELVVRNGPVANVVRMITGPSHQERRLAPGELITIRLYMPAAGAIVPVTISSESGFRPAELEEKNLDFRWLGVWVELR